jgi:hypothetical protein
LLSRAAPELVIATAQGASATLANVPLTTIGRTGVAAADPAATIKNAVPKIIERLNMRLNLLHVVG